ncbi:hypothetical protein JYU34_020263 [Plutella xylostella]|uniref:Uncharacterized protein n=1 Tax=Plutella xylostella TaxID=51655 RepID=A0ABQ7PU71_PLUXY|nr:hypothetical protein JYU34_020263 [Plutella xylostella]
MASELINSLKHFCILCFHSLLGVEVRTSPIYSTNYSLSTLNTVLVFALILMHKNNVRYYGTRALRLYNASYESLISLFYMYLVFVYLTYMIKYSRIYIYTLVFTYILSPITHKTAFYLGISGHYNCVKCILDDNKSHHKSNYFLLTKYLTMNCNSYLAHIFSECFVRFEHASNFDSSTTNKVYVSTLFSISLEFYKLFRYNLLLRNVKFTWLGRHSSYCPVLLKLDSLSYIQNKITCLFTYSVYLPCPITSTFMHTCDKRCHINVSLIIFILFLLVYLLEILLLCITTFYNGL